MSFICIIIKTHFHNKGFALSLVLKVKLLELGNGLLTNQVDKQSLIPSTDVIQLTLTLKMTTEQVIETSLTVNNSPIEVGHLNKIFTSVIYTVKSLF